MDQRSEAGLDPRPGRLRLARAARAEADGLRARRAERLARIRAGAALANEPENAAPVRDPDDGPALPERDVGGAERDADGEPALPERDVEGEPTLPARDVEALERFLADLVGTIDTEPAPPQPARLAPVLPLARPAGESPAGDAADLSRLPGAGPGLVGALIRGGVPDLAALAGLGRDALSDRLGPLGRLIDLDGWLAFARAATGRAAPPHRVLERAGPVPEDLAG